MSASTTLAATGSAWMAKGCLSSTAAPMAPMAAGKYRTEIKSYSRGSSRTYATGVTGPGLVRGAHQVGSDHRARKLDGFAHPGARHKHRPRVGGEQDFRHRGQLHAGVVHDRSGPVLPGPHRLYGQLGSERKPLQLGLLQLPVARRSVDALSRGLDDLDGEAALGHQDVHQHGRHRHAGHGLQARLHARQRTVLAAYLGAALRRQRRLSRADDIRLADGEHMVEQDHRGFDADGAGKLPGSDLSRCRFQRRRRSGRLRRERQLRGRNRNSAAAFCCRWQRLHCIEYDIYALRRFSLARLRIGATPKRRPGRTIAVCRLQRRRLYGCRLMGLTRRWGLAGTTPQRKLQWPATLARDASRKQFQWA